MKTSVLKICQESFFDDLTKIKIYKKKTESLESYMTDIPNSLQEKQVTTPVGRFSTPGNIGTELSENEGRVVEYQQDIEELNNLRSMLLENQNEGLNENTAEDVISRIEPITKNVDEDVRIPSLEQFTDIHTKIPAIKITLEAIDELIPLLETNINKRKELIYDNILHLSQEGFFDKIKGLFSTNEVKITAEERNLKQLKTLIDKIKYDSKPNNENLNDKKLVDNLGFCKNYSEILATVDIQIDLTKSFERKTNDINPFDFIIKEINDKDILDSNFAKKITDKLNSIFIKFKPLSNYKISSNDKLGIGPLITNTIMLVENNSLDLSIIFEKSKDSKFSIIKTLSTDELNKVYLCIKNLLATIKHIDYKYQLGGIEDMTEYYKYLFSDENPEKLNHDLNSENRKKLITIMVDTAKLGLITMVKLEEINLKSVNILMEYINLSLKEYGIDTKLELSKEDFFDKLNKDILFKNIGLESFMY